MTLVVLNPIQEPLAGDVTTSASVSPRPSTLDGKTLGLWHNEKLNAAKLLELIAAELARDFTFDVRRGTYDSGALMATDGWGDIDECDVAILANGDCGACSTSGIANAIELERRGIPALLVSTPPFVEAVAASAALRGMPSIRWAVVDHPVASLDESQLRTRAVVAAAQFREMVLAAPAASEQRGVAAAAP